MLKSYLSKFVLMQMPDIVSDCYNGRLGVSLTEQRLKRFGKEGSFLTKESNIKPVFYVLSIFRTGEIIHRVAPNKDGLIKKQSFDEATVQWCLVS